MRITVCGLAITPVKGTRLQTVERICLQRTGVRENRRFYVVDARGRMLNGKQLGGLQAVIAQYSDQLRQLRMTFPDGRVIEDEVRVDGSMASRFYSRTEVGKLVMGPWSGALSEYLGQPLRLLEAGEAGAVDRGARGAVSLISRASLIRLGEIAATDAVDGRRFRMLLEVEGPAAHGEDEWVGHAVRIGEASVRFRGHVGRCLVTSRDPDTGCVDLPTLDIIGSYRPQHQTTEPLPFGIYGEVLEPGSIAIGDELVLAVE